MDFSMTEVTDGRGIDGESTWHKQIVLEGHHAQSISWDALLYYAENHWRWLQSDPARNRRANTTTDARLVAALFVPRANGGMIFLSTIVRGLRKDILEQMGPEVAPTWWQANLLGDRGPSRLCAEDGAIYLFESNFRYSDNYVDPDNGRYKVPEPLVGNIRIACYGKFGDDPRPIGPQNLCNGGKRPKPCTVVALSLGIEYWTQQKHDAEKGELGIGPSPPTSGQGQSRRGGRSSSRQPPVNPSNPAGGESSSTTYPAYPPSDTLSMDRLTTSLGGLQISNGSSTKPDGYRADDGKWYYQASDRNWYIWPESKLPKTSIAATSTKIASSSNTASVKSSSSTGKKPSGKAAAPSKPKEMKKNGKTYVQLRGSDGEKHWYDKKTVSK